MLAYDQSIKIDATIPKNADDLLSVEQVEVLAEKLIDAKESMPENSLRP